MNVLSRTLIACIPLVCGCGESDGVAPVAGSDTPAAHGERHACGPAPQMFGPGGDALLVAAEREIAETQKLVDDLKRQGLAQDDLAVVDELARKIKNGTMTPEDEKRLRRMIRATERQLELERLRHQHCPSSPHSAAGEAPRRMW